MFCSVLRRMAAEHIPSIGESIVSWLLGSLGSCNSSYFIRLLTLPTQCDDIGEPSFVVAMSGQISMHTANSSEFPKSPGYGQLVTKSV
jgi:hypothetical protein